MHSVHLEDGTGADSYAQQPEFEPTDPQDMLALPGFVYEQMVEPPSQ